LSKFLIFIIVIFSISFLYIFYFLGVKKNNTENYLIIEKGNSINNITEKILINENFINKKIYFYFLKIYNNHFNTLKFGEYKINSNLNLIEITYLISNNSNVYKKFTVVDGWEEYQLTDKINEIFNKNIKISYLDILADTYIYQLHNDFSKIFNLMKKNKRNFFEKHKANLLLKKYTINEIMTIASLVEKEGKSDDDKRLISSVILNRLNQNMKLDIDATVIFAITKGQHKFDRKLSMNDLKLKDNFNTYLNKGLPNTPICYVSRKTIELVLENYKSTYLFYFFNKDYNKHVFSKTYNQHKKLLNEYRKNQ
tara:strand:- start:573 stop:1505 length:933 start_codon:yes stop_codon:yes gene_type:complete